MAQKKTKEHEIQLSYKKQTSAPAMCEITTAAPFWRTSFPRRCSAPPQRATRNTRNKRLRRPTAREYARTFNTAPIQTQKRFADNLTMLSGPGGSVVVLNGPDGKFVVDTFVAPPGQAQRRLSMALAMLR